ITRQNGLAWWATALKWWKTCPSKSQATLITNVTCGRNATAWATSYGSYSPQRVYLPSTHPPTGAIILGASRYAMFSAPNRSARTGQRADPMPDYSQHNITTPTIQNIIQQ